MPQTNRSASLASVLASLSEQEARAIYAALGQYVDNQSEYVESCDGVTQEERASLAAAETVLGRLDAEIASSGSLRAPMGHTYALKYRPAGFGTLPKGWRDPAPHKDFRFGTVVYGEALSTDDVESFELVEIPTDARIALLVQELSAPHLDIARDIVDLASDDRIYFVAIVGQWIDKANVHIDRETFSEKVLAHLRSYLDSCSR